MTAWRCSQAAAAQVDSTGRDAHRPRPPPVPGHRAARARAPRRARRRALPRLVARARRHRRPDRHHLAAAAGQRLAAPRRPSGHLRPDRGLPVGQPPHRLPVAGRARRRAQPRRHHRQRRRHAGRPGRAGGGRRPSGGRRLRQLDGGRAPASVLPRRRLRRPGLVAGEQRLQRGRRHPRRGRPAGAALPVRLAAGAGALRRSARPARRRVAQAPRAWRGAVQRLL